MLPASAGASTAPAAEPRPALPPVSGWFAPDRRGPFWLGAIAVVGFGVSVYLTTIHYAHVAPICSDSGFVNCSLALNSVYSVVPGTSVPITVPGMAWFLVSLGLAASQWARPGRQAVVRAHLLWACLGMLSVFYLIFVELVELHAICAWCSSVHLMILLTLLITAWRWQTARYA